MNTMTTPGGAPRVVVVGAGVIGVCCAYFLARRGVRVLVVERERIAAGASSGNAGVIAPGHLPLVKPGRFWSLVKTVFRPLSPVYVPLRFDPALWRWLFTFSRQFSEARADEAMEAVAPLGKESLSLYEQLVREEGIECDFRRRGYYEVWRSASGPQEAAREIAFARRHGFRAELLDPREMLRREPSLREGLTCAVHHCDAATLDPYAFVAALAERARAAGAEFRVATGVVQLQVRDGRVHGVLTAQGEEIPADAVVVAAGAWSASLLRPLGISLPLEAAKGYHCDLVPSETAAVIREACVLAERLVFVTPMGHRTRLAGTLEFSGLDSRIREARWRQLSHAAGEYFQGVEQSRSVSKWCGLRPCLPDGLPAIGPAPGIHGLYLATGHAMAGMTLGPATGRRVADWILGRPSAAFPTPLSPARFA